MERIMKIWNVDHYDIVEKRNGTDVVVKCYATPLERGIDMISIEEFIRLYNDHDSIQWQYNHIKRYKNVPAALQWLTARANEAHFNTLSLQNISEWEDSGFTNNFAKAMAEKYAKDAEKWAGTAKAFEQLRDQEMSIEDYRAMRQAETAEAVEQMRNGTFKLRSLTEFPRRRETPLSADEANFYGMDE
jgi:hypothetical protein